MKSRGDRLEHRAVADERGYQGGAVALSEENGGRGIKDDLRRRVMCRRILFHALISRGQRGQ